MSTLMDKLKVEEDKLNLELEESHGNYEIMKVVFEKRLDLFSRFLKQESLTNLDLDVDVCDLVTVAFI
jgi:hypothetical protein